MFVCKGVLNDTCLGAGWLKGVMASSADVDASLGILHLTISRLFDAM